MEEIAKGLKVAGDDGYAKKKPLKLRLREGAANEKSTIECVSVDLPGGQIEIRHPTVAEFELFSQFKDEAPENPLQAGLGMALFFCHDPDTGELVWDNTEEDIAWLRAQPMSWLNDLAAKGATVLKMGADIEAKKKD